MYPQNIFKILNSIYTCATKLGYQVELKQTSHPDLDSALYIISAILNKKYKHSKSYEWVLYLHSFLMPI